MEREFKRIEREDVEQLRSVRDLHLKHVLRAHSEPVRAFVGKRTLRKKRFGRRGGHVSEE